MVAGPFVFARRFVNGARLHLRLERIAHQDVVNAQAAVATKGKLAVVPPRIGFLRLFKEAIRIVQPQREQLSEMGAFLIGAVDGASQGHRVPHITVIHRDVEVTHQHQAGMMRQLLAYPVMQSLEPAHLVDKLVAVRRLAIGEVGTNHAHPVHRGADHARHVISKTGNVAHHVGGGCA